MKKTKNRNSILVSNNLIEFLSQPNIEIQVSNKFSDKASYLAEEAAGGAAWDAVCELRKLIAKLPAIKQREFETYLNILLVSLSEELIQYKKLHSTKSKRESAAEPIYSLEFRKKVLGIFSSKRSFLSNIERARLTVIDLEKKKYKPIPTPRTILNWVKSSK